MKDMLLLIVATVAIAAGAWGFIQSMQVRSLEDSLRVKSELLATAQHNVAALTAQIEQTREAQAVLQSELARERADRFRYQSLIEEIEELNDETPVPPAVAAALDRLRRDQGCDPDRDAGAGCAGAAAGTGFSAQPDGE